MATRKLLGAAAVVACFAGGGIAGSIVIPAIAAGGKSAVISTANPPAEPSPVAGPPDGPGRGDRGPGGPGARGGGYLDVGTVAGALGMQVPDLLGSLRGGSSIAQIATARGVDVQTVIDALVAKASGGSTPSAELTARITAAVNQPLGRRG